MAERIFDYDLAYPRDLRSVAINPVLPDAQQHEVLGRSAEGVVPPVRREVSTTLWGPSDSGRAAGLSG